MHRAEKSSSKICRAREVEKAQELHRRKIDGVKSYLCGIIPKPNTSRTAASFRHRSTKAMLGSFSSVTCVHGDPTLSAGASLANSQSSGDLEPQQSEKTDTSIVVSETLVLDGGSHKTSVVQETQSLDDFQRSLAKMAEFRGVAPVPGLGSVTSNKNLSSKFAPPPAESRKKSLNGSFRARRLKEIKADNAEVFERIKKSVSHYRNDELRREWQQNMSYLSSISEFPVAVDSLTVATSIHKQQHDDNDRNCFGPSPRRPSFLRAPNRTEPLPSIPVVAHPIKSIPTSPKKLQLNMTPAFRSLRKAMPQQPSLPPISSPHRVLNVGGASDSCSNMSSKILSSPRGRSTCPNSPGIDDRFAESTSGRNIPHRSSTAIAATKFIGDLHGRQAENDVSGDAKYQLLKTGRFVGGTYLVLTVFCGDGVTNPYGFDVFAYHRELQCEYKLSITKEMTHELLDKSSSSSLAAETAAAAGTNLSMQEIARNICDHINFAILGTDQGEIIFLAPTVARKSDQALQFDASPGLVAFCVHQCVELECDEIKNSIGSRSRFDGSSSKRRAHVFASTCPPTNYPTSAASTSESKNNGRPGTAGLTVCFQVMDSLPPSRCTTSFESNVPCASALEVEVSVDELYSCILCDLWRDQHRILSMDRMVVATIQHLHIITVPSDDEVGTLRSELIVNSHVNTQLHPCSSRLVGSTALEKKRSRQQLPHSTSQLFTQPIRATILVQSGLIWRNAYLLAEVALDSVDDTDFVDTWSRQRSRRRLIQDVGCDLVISVFNANSGRSSCRRLPPEKVSMLLEKFELLPNKFKVKSGIAGESISEQHIFAKALLAFLQLDVDLFGQEVIVFPALEHPHQPNESDTEISSDKEADPAASEVRLPRRTSWEEENISEGDEDIDSDEYDNEQATELMTGVEPYDTEDEDDDGDQDEAGGSYSSYPNQDEADQDSLSDVVHESVKLQEHATTKEEAPENEDGTLSPSTTKQLTSNPNTSRSWRQGRKINGHFVLVQGSGIDLATCNVKYFRNSFRTDQYQQHHELSHCETWKRYQACSDEEKRAFFPLPEGVTPEMPVPPVAPSQKLKVELAPGEVWALEPTREERQRCFEIAPAIVELVAVLAIGATEPTVDNAIEKQSHRVMDHAHEPTSNAVARWCPPRDTFQSCTLVGTVVEPLYRVVAFSRSQIDCLVELAAAGLSFRQISSAMQSFRSHAPVLLRDLVNSHGAENDAIAAAADKQFRAHQNTSPRYDEEQTAEFVRLIIAVNLSVTSRLLQGCWAFSLVLRASMEHAPVRSYLEFRVKVYGGGAMHNVHLISIPAFESKCKLMMFSTLERVLNAVLPNWRHRLIGVATDGDAQMPPRVLDIVARLQQEAATPVVYRSSSGCHQLDCIVTNFYSSLQGGCFLLVLKELSAYIRRQPELLARMDPPPSSPTVCHSSISSKERWLALGKETNWIAAHRELLSQHFDAEKPPSAPDNSWWLFFAAVDWVATRVNETFENLLRNHATIADQIAAVAALSKDCATAFHAIGPLNDSLLTTDSFTNRMYKSRKGLFALGKPGMFAFIKETSQPSIQIINTTEVPVVDLVMENLSICGVNMIESLLELSTALKDEQGPSARHGANDLKVTEFVPPTLPHELAQLSTREFSGLLTTYGPMVRSFMSEEDIDLMDQELQGLRRGAVRESVLSAALANCSADTPFDEAWSLTESRFKLLECFAGGFASVFSCAPIAASGGTSDLALCRSDMETARVLLADFTIEGSLHAQQFPALMALNDKLNAESNRNKSAGTSMVLAQKIVGAITATDAFKKDHKSPDSLAVALCEGFMAADEMLKEDPEFATSCDEVGSTGLFAIVTPKDVVCANVGDSRCILSNAKIPEVLQLSVDHKPDLEFEKQRIVAAGGTVFRGRVCGGVAVSRSFGDLWFKRNADLKPHQQLVTSEPCVRVQRRDPADEFLVLCCDGIYDVMSNDQLRKFIRSKLKNGVKNPKDIAEMLVDECLAKGSRDNMSAVIVLFDAALKK
ncbi:unnamed protein product [Phytophthora lilii]|uniref:Unnamed protein product n=1 Tax=Phytophthora lilii TaxID=2077276 RepID=A0A9W7DCV6_9STRA|nr:unnamed protein product [Phytophthora lilii]